MAKNKVTSTEMVRTALTELGPDAKPLAIQQFIKERFNGKELSTTIISNYKSVMKRKGGGKRKGGPGRPPKSAGGGSIAIQDLEAFQTIVRKMGAENVKKLLSLMG
jgi:hypothetical protein